MSFLSKMFRSPRHHGYSYTKLHARALPMMIMPFKVKLSPRSVSITGVTIMLLILLLLVPWTVVPQPSSSAQPLSSPNACPSRPPTTKYVPRRHDRFDWSKVPVKHPVQKLASLSRDTTEPPSRQSARRVQFDFLPPTTDELHTRQYRQQQVRETFKHCWKSYRERAWKMDELSPVSGGSKNPFGGWGATLVDSLDTLHIMDLHDEFEEAVTTAIGIDFGPDTSSLTLVNMFETTIRYLGGYLAAYDMTACQDKRLLDKAIEVGDMIYASYDTPNRMPVTRWDPRRKASGHGEEQGPADNAIIAEFASSSLEFTRISQITGDMKWFDAGQRMTDVMDQQQNHTKLPGMWPIGISSLAPDLTRGNQFGFGAMSDSAYEYLPKMFALLAGADPATQYQKLTTTFMDVAMEHMFYRPMVPDNADILMPSILTVDELSQQKRLDSGAQHLACFTGGMFLLAGKLFGRDDQIDVGRKVTNGCIWGYQHSLLGIMPEMFRMHPCKDKKNCKWNRDEWAANAQEGRPEGFTSIDDPKYILRPEAIESVFYLYRITGDAHLQDVAWDMFTAISNRTRTDFANAAIDDVTVAEAPKADSMESFWMGETLKYFYLMFSDPALVSLDDFVLNTEAHPFRIPKS